MFSAATFAREAHVKASRFVGKLEKCTNLVESGLIWFILSMWLIDVHNGPSQIEQADGWRMLLSIFYLFVYLCEVIVLPFNCYHWQSSKSSHSFPVRHNMRRRFILFARNLRMWSWEQERWVGGSSSSGRKTFLICYAQTMEMNVWYK